MTVRDLEDVLAVVKAAAGVPQWPRSAYECVLASDPTAALSRFALVSHIASSIAPRAGEMFAGAGVVSLSRLERLAELEIIVVHPAFQRHGIGTGLLRCLLDTAGQAGAQAVRLEVRESNAAALALYRGQGFREAGRRRRYYSAPVEDGLLFEKSLPGGG